jgi:hypothetical protein
MVFVTQVARVVIDIQSAFGERGDVVDDIGEDEASFRLAILAQIGGAHQAAVPLLDSRAAA